MTMAPDLKFGQSYTDLEAAFESQFDTFFNGLRAEIYAPWDADNITEGMLAYLAETFQADAWNADAGIPYKRRVVQDAISLSRIKGTIAGLNLFGETAGVIVDITLKRSSGVTRYDQVDIVLSRTQFEAGIDENDWVAYITRVLHRLLPIGITIDNITFAFSVSKDANIGP